MERLKKYFLAAIISAGLVCVSLFYAFAQYEYLNKAQQQAIRKCRDQYVQALLAYNSADKDKVIKSLKDAAESAKGADERLVDLMKQLEDEFKSEQFLSFSLTRQTAIILNTYNEEYSLGYPMFNPGNPALADPEWKSEKNNTKKY